MTHLVNGKLFKEIKKELNLKDIESSDNDLIDNKKENCNCPICGEQLNKMLSTWHIGYNAYVVQAIEGLIFMKEVIIFKYLRPCF